MTDEQPRSYDELFEDTHALLDSTERHLARAQALLESTAVRSSVVREIVATHHNQARSYFLGASLVGGIATAVATNSFWFGVAAGVGLKWGTLGLEHLGKANAVTQHYAGLLIGVEATSRTDEPPAQPAALPPEASDQEPLPGA